MDKNKSYKSFKEFFQSCPLQKCSSATSDGELISSQDRISSDLGSSLAATYGDQRKPPKTSLKDKIAALVDQNKVVPSQSRTIPSTLICSGSDENRHCEEDDEFAGKKRSSLQSCNEVDFSTQGAEEGGGRADEDRNETDRASLSSNLFPKCKRQKHEPTLLPTSNSERKNSSTDAILSFADSEEEGTQIARLGDDEELGMDNEGGLFSQSIPEGPFEALRLWPPGEEGLPDGGEDDETIIEVPASINSRLLEHQRGGVRFLYNLYRNNKGGILGDDMGLGKTIQIIAFLAAILRNDSSYRKESLLSSLSTKLVGIQKQRVEKAVLIICPTSVVPNWEQEFHVWGEFQVGVCHGLQREITLSKVLAKEVEVVLTTHDTFRIYGDEFCKIDWDCGIVDEAHRLKNDKSQFYIMCLKLRTKKRYGLTGTVMQNKYMEMFNVFDWATPGCLGTRDHFREYHAGPITEGQRISAPQRFVTIAEDRKKHLNLVLGKYLLRRTKQETIGHLMKGKEDNVVFCPMSSVQKRAYGRVLKSPDYQALKMRGLPCSCGGPLTRAECCYRTTPNGVIWPSLHKDSLDSGCDSCPYCLMLPCLTKLRLLSNHLELIKPNPKDDPEKQEKDYNFARMALGEDADIIGGVEQEASFLGLSDSQHCGKMAVLERLLSSWITQGDKVLLFSDSVRMLDILEKFLIRKGYCFSRLDGAVPMNARQALVEDFNHSHSKQIFLISTRAGGLGLNLTSANRVVIFDPNWNPAHDLQAQDRSFRFGQHRHVTVFRLLAAGTLEELVYTRQIYKQQLFNIAMAGAAEKRYFEGVQGSKQHKGELFGLSNLFRDISEDLFAEDIIENHEERFIRIQKMAVLEAETSSHEHTEGEDPEDKLDYLGDLTCDKTDNTVSPQLATKEQDEVDDEEERRMQSMVHKALTKAGVVYSHRNEDVVNLQPSFQKASTILNCTAKVPKSQDNKENVQQTRRESNRNLGRQAQKMTPPGGIGPVKGKDPLTLSSSQSKKQVVGDDKRAKFAQLAQFKGMNVSEFSNWIVTLTPKERIQLNLDYNKSLARSSS